MMKVSPFRGQGGQRLKRLADMNIAPPAACKGLENLVD
jgi:hypothetical protein